jgi:ribulose-phosphate 3-epimerase
VQIKLSPSILNADFGRLAEQVREAEAAGADYLHVDVMDGQFVPNITLGPAIVAAIRQATTIPLDLHLMIEEPGRFLREFVEAGAGIMTVHSEAVRHLHATVAAIQDAGIKAGVALNPATPLSAVEEVVDRLDLLLIMTVNPGFGGQSYLSGSNEKIQRAHALRTTHHARYFLEVDGGITKQTIAAAHQAGADTFVAGNAIFASADPGREVQELRRRCMVTV